MVGRQGSTPLLTQMSLSLPPLLFGEWGSGAAVLAWRKLSFPLGLVLTFKALA